MKVLMLCLRSPYPPSDGGSIAMYNMAEALYGAGASVKVLSFNTRKHLVDPRRVDPTFRARYQPDYVSLDAEVRLIPAFMNLFTSDSYNVSRFDIPEFHQELEQLLHHQSFDIIQLESLFMTPYIKTIRAHSKAKVVFRAHNVEYVIWNRLAAQESNPLKKSYLRFLAKRLEHYESQVLQELDAILPLTPDDLAVFRRMGLNRPECILPIGIDTSRYAMEPGINGIRNLAHLGSMDWLPNLEAVQWFMDAVYPLLQPRWNDFTLHLAGKNMPDNFFSLASDRIQVSGKIDDVRAFFMDKQIMIVPLLSGSGMRVKIIEGLAMGRTIISTTIGAEGIGYTPGVNMLIADTPEAFAGAVTRCIGDPGYTLQIGRAAAELAAKDYDNRSIGLRLINFYEGLLAVQHSPVS